MDRPMITSEQEKAIAEYIRRKGNWNYVDAVFVNDLPAAVAALLAERDELRARCEKAEAGRDAARAKLGVVSKASNRLANEAAGCLGMAEFELRQVLGNTNYNCMDAAALDVRAAIASEPEIVAVVDSTAVSDGYHRFSASMCCPFRVILLRGAE